MHEVIWNGDRDKIICSQLLAQLPREVVSLRGEYGMQQPGGRHHLGGAAGVAGQQHGYLATANGAGVVVERNNRIVAITGGKGGAGGVGADACDRAGRGRIVL